MKRYPVNKQGIAISPYELGYNIPSLEDIKDRETNNHHHHFHSWQYQDQLGFIFRNLVDNLSPLYFSEHNHLHRHYEAPKRPRQAVMIEAIEERLAVFGTVEVVLKKCTNHTRLIAPEQWARMKNGNIMLIGGCDHAI